MSNRKEENKRRRIKRRFCQDFVVLFVKILFMKISLYGDFIYLFILFIYLFLFMMTLFLKFVNVGNLEFFRQFSTSFKKIKNFQNYKYDYIPFLKSLYSYLKGIQNMSKVIIRNKGIFFLFWGGGGYFIFRKKMNIWIHNTILPPNEC